MRRVRRSAGFSLVELITVVAIMMVVAAVSTPYMLRTIATIRLRSSCQSLAGLLQQARMQAVKQNRFYTVIPNNLSGQIRDACLDLNWNGTCDSGEPIIQMAQGVTMLTSGGPGTTLMTCGSTGPATCPTGYTNGMSFIPEPATVKPSFSARGLPCVGNPAATAPTWPSALCYTTDPNTSNPAGFLYVFQYDGMLSTQYAAVAITPAGRINVWMNTGNNGTNDTWSQ